MSLRLLGLNISEPEVSLNHLANWEAIATEAEKHLRCN